MTLDEKIDELVKGTASRFEKLERLIFNEVINYLSESLHVRETRITFNAQNYGVISAIDKLMQRFSTAVGRIGKYIIDGIRSVMGLTVDQLTKVDVRAAKTGNLVIDELLNHSATIINKILSLETIFLDIKQTAISLLTGPDGLGLTELREQLRIKVVGNKIAQRYFSRWTHDIYSQMQRIGANRIRIDLGLKYAIYQGGLIATSRDFCEERNNKCFSDDEIMSWKNLDWVGKPEIGYNPLIDCGGYNCRHRLDWISNQLAKRLRPDLFNGENKPVEPIKPIQPIAPVQQTKPIQPISLGFEKRFDDDFNKNNVPDLIKNVVNILPKPKRISSISKIKNETHYDRTFNTITAKIKDGPAGLYHEYGHYIDMYKMRTNTPQENIIGLNSRSVNELMKLSVSKDSKIINDKYKGQLKNIVDQIKGKKEYEGFSDIIDAMTGGKFRDIYKAAGHGVRYYNQAQNLKYHEIYANMFEIITSNNKQVLKEVKEHFPNIHDFVLNDLKSIK